MLPSKIRVAVFFEHELSSGGNHQQSLNLTKLLCDSTKEIADIVCYVTSNNNMKVLNNIGVESVLYNPSAASLILLKLTSLLPKQILTFIRKFIKYNSLEKSLHAHSIDLVYFTSQSSFAACLEKTNYIYTLYDLCHRDFPEFPEVSAFREFENRELHFHRSLSKAIAVFCDSHLGRKNAINRYGLNPDRVHVLPSSPAFDISDSNNDDATEQFFDVKRHYSINSDYIFYPAQFWSHKNHIYILHGLKLLELNYGLKLSAVFCGSDKGNLEYIKISAKKLGIFDRIKFLGFVDNSHIKFLYKQSLALVMPTFFGPTNLPPLEAFALGVPVIYSDLPGLRDQVGDAGLLTNLDHPDNLALHINNIYHNDRLRSDLINKGFLRLSELNNSSRNKDLVVDIIKTFQKRRMCWPR